MKVYKTVVTTQIDEVDLKAIPINEWPLEIRSLITPRLIERAKKELFPKDYLIAKVEQLYQAHQELMKELELS